MLIAAETTIIAKPAAVLQANLFHDRQVSSVGVTAFNMTVKWSTW